jgi:membrane fusion protein, copper/silver efflux system
MKRKLILIGAAAVVAVFFIGLWVGRSTHKGAEREDGLASATGASVRFWTCAMHPQIRQPKPGNCPICGMKLIPVSGDGQASPLGPRQVRLSPAAMKLAEIQTLPVVRQFPTAEVRMVGKVEYDESRRATISAWVPGRLERLFVDYTGVPVRQGDHLVSIYSPDLLVAQQELLLAAQAVKGLDDAASALVRERAAATLNAAREKLRLWGFGAGQIAAIEQTNRPSDRLTIQAPISGIVIEKPALEGAYVNTGDRIYAIADLSRLWVRLDAYESDLPWIHYGQAVEFSTEAFPGEKFTGRIAFIDPVLNAMTRTVKVRVNVENPGGRLKPEMFVRAVVRARVASGGKVMDPALAGKWISPMHPEIVKDHSGQCDVCGMALVSAESLGYLPSDSVATNAPLLIPASAPLITGRRAVVYVAVTNEVGVFEGREVVLGPRAGNLYVVQEGLREGEQVVVSGNFKLDSEIQIQAKPSMMNPDGGAPAPGHQHGAPAPAAAPEGHSAGALPVMETPAAFRTQLDDVLREYLALQTALASDQDGRAESGRLRDALAKLDMALLTSPAAHSRWMKLLPGLRSSVGTVVVAGSLADRRVAFAGLSASVTELAHAFGVPAALHVMHCPMALGGKGARWLQDSPELRNPYYGAKMLQCGDRVETIFPTAKNSSAP